MPKRETYFDVITAMVNDITENGFDSAERIAYWQQRLKEAAEASMLSQYQMEQGLRDLLVSKYRSLVERGEIAKFHEGVGRFTLDKVRPQLRAELDRRIMAAANLIKLNRKQAIEKTLQRFAGWSTSISKGGAAPGKKQEAKQSIRKALVSLPFEERRVLIDQGHKLVSSLNDILATDGGAIAAIWEHVHQRGYDGRPEHVARDTQVFLIRNSWAHSQGLVKAGRDEFTDQIEQPAELPFCRCRYRYVYALGKVPAAMLTKKGEKALAEAKEKLNAL
jgi:hypothetical protein